MYVGIYGTSGRVIKKLEPVAGRFGYQTMNFPLDGLEGGLYLIQLRSGKFKDTMQVLKK
ncbi:MAG TPA: hypothetical protein VJ203_13205 [Bacteroidales bacterium]|nr:hypothetical protein [Bacteroidales bacterium]